MHTNISFMRNRPDLQRLRKELHGVRKGVMRQSFQQCVDEPRHNRRQFVSPTGVHTINVVRDRPDLQRLREELQGLGATLVTTEDALKADLAAAQLPRPALGLNCIGGSSSAAVAKALEYVLVCSGRTVLVELCNCPPPHPARARQSNCVGGTSSAAVVNSPCASLHTS